MAEKLAPGALQALQNINAGLPASHGLSGRSEFGGLTRSMGALIRRGLITSLVNPQITDAGRQALDAAAKPS